ncbi:hypothetical protein BS78_03G054200 [Paspalum vaginatum]|nr:hypothetical protein BS78_03G054200 [Paspalum vaginatum]
MDLLRLRDSIPMVSLAVSAAMLYARAASSRFRPGLPRLTALVPVVAFLTSRRPPWRSPPPPSCGAWRASSSRGSARSRSSSSPPAAGRSTPPSQSSRSSSPPRSPSNSGAAAEQRSPRPADRFLRGEGRRHSRAPPCLPVQEPAESLRPPRALRRPHVLLRRPPPPLHRSCRRRARHGAGAAVRPAVPRVLAARLLGPAVEPHGARHPPAVGLRPRALARREAGRRHGRVPRVRADARGVRVLPHPLFAHGRDDGLLPAPRRVLRGRGVVRAAVGDGAAAAARGHAARGRVCGGYGVLALLPADLQAGRGGRAAGGVGGGGGLLRRRRPSAVPVCLTG